MLKLHRLFIKNHEKYKKIFASGLVEKSTFYFRYKALAWDRPTIISTRPVLIPLKTLIAS